MTFKLSKNVKKNKPYNYPTPDALHSSHSLVRYFSEIAPLPYRVNLLPAAPPARALHEFHRLVNHEIGIPIVIPFPIPVPVPLSMSIFSILDSDRGPAFDSDSGFDLKRYRFASRFRSRFKFPLGTSSHTDSGHAFDSTLHPTLDSDLVPLPVSVQVSTFISISCPMSNIDSAAGHDSDLDEDVPNTSSVPFAVRPITAEQLAREYEASCLAHGARPVEGVLQQIQASGPATIACRTVSPSSKDRNLRLLLCQIRVSFSRVPEAKWTKTEPL
ncbi:hypothetical protein EVAR_43810_1 [Eumeta japonica]|uniref:Uncharacterized protein n=1 Tax=Eumeta variegata TaxID=151549 RepID=A0A4C1WX67_EUMVA|nr:hypothetical protein EVAR_43810_1 [Eumeta japonica]